MNDIGGDYAEGWGASKGIRPVVSKLDSLVIYMILTRYRWFWCERKNIRLPDEYDRIYHDLEPFRGMDLVDLRAAGTCAY